MLTVGLTGGFGTGKSTVARLFGQKGAKVIDADKLAHALISSRGPCFNKVVKVFGRDILTKGKIDRRKLAKVVFVDAGKLKRLEGIIHPEVGKKIKRQLTKLSKQKNIKLVIVEVPLLFESNLDRMVDYTLVVKASRAVQMRRLQKKGILKNEIVRRIKAQMPIHQKIRLADLIIDNRGSLASTKRQVQDMWKKFNLEK